MPFLIDGHNLIPKLGLRLDSPDDEQDLLAVLAEFCRLRRAQAEVYFDGAPPGSARTSKSGALKVHFIRQGSSADAAIEARLEHLGRSARNWSVVSSDRRVQRAAQAVHAQPIASEAFARMIAEAKREQAERAKTSAGKSSPEEVEAWLAEFKGRPPKS
jgi:predicted RNA-binding protein with PIN domain